MSQRKNKDKRRKTWHKVLGIFLGILLGVSCRYVPEDYETACEQVAKIAAVSCGG